MVWGVVVAVGCPRTRMPSAPHTARSSSAVCTSSSSDMPDSSACSCTHTTRRGRPARVVAGCSGLQSFCLFTMRLVLEGHTFRCFCSLNGSPTLIPPNVLRSSLCFGAFLPLAPLFLPDDLWCCLLPWPPGTSSPDALTSTADELSTSDAIVLP